MSICQKARSHQALLSLVIHFPHCIPQICSIEIDDIPDNLNFASQYSFGGFPRSIPCGHNGCNWPAPFRHGNATALILDFIEQSEAIGFKGGSIEDAILHDPSIRRIWSDDHLFGVPVRPQACAVELTQRLRPLLQVTVEEGDAVVHDQVGIGALEDAILNLASSEAGRVGP